MFIWNFIQTEILGMQWLNQLTGICLEKLGFDLDSAIGGSIHFFFYDTIKIFILLSVLIFSISYIQSYFPPERAREILSRFHGITANTFAALLGTVTPFCSCSSIPLFIGFSSANVPIGITFSFLISSPLVDLGSLVLLTSIFGIKIAVAYVVVGLILAIIGGLCIEKLGMEAYLTPLVRNAASAQILAQPELTKKERIQYAKEQLLTTIQKVAPYIFVGVGIGAAIHNFIPESFVESVLGSDTWYAVPLATIIGIPMYADIFGTIPIAESLFAKGAGLGTVLAFMMAVTALSLPSFILLRQAVKPRLLGVFIVIVAIGITFIGYFFNTMSFLFI